MRTEPHHGDAHHHHKPRHLAEKFEGLVGVIMVAAIILLAFGFIYGILTTGASDPKWMQ